MQNERKVMGEFRNVFAVLGASNHVPEDREENDYYATDPRIVHMILLEEKFNHLVWEPACGEGHISKVLEEHGYDVVSTDLIDRGYGEGGVNFLDLELDTPFEGDIITNPPYKLSQDFVEKALSIVEDGAKVMFLLRLQFLEGQRRRELFQKTPPKTIYISSSRTKCAKNGDFDNIGSGAVAFAWFVWEKGFQGDPVIKWFN